MRILQFDPGAAVTGAITFRRFEPVILIVGAERRGQRPARGWALPGAAPRAGHPIDWPHWTDAISVCEPEDAIFLCTHRNW